jgi:predicted N-formylglutamate amidohydrolase
VRCKRPAPGKFPRAFHGSDDIRDTPLPGLLGKDDPTPAAAEPGGGHSPFLLVCDHAGRAIPRALGRLGLPEAALETHVAWDIGALDLARRLALGLGADLIHQRYSRLVIDCNRAPEHPHSIVTTVDGWEVAGNFGLSAQAAADRRDALFRPYHDRIAAELDARSARGADTLLVCIHSFTPSLGGMPRPWDLGVLHMGNSTASAALLALLGQESGLVVGDNQPYAMDGTDYTAPFHAHRRGLDAVEIEVRQDWLQSGRGIETMAALFVRLLPLAQRQGRSV